MDISARYQDQHNDKPQVDWIQIQKVERDICLLYHQLANYSYIMGDLYYGTVFVEEYWNYLDVQCVEPGTRAFLRDGCLVMILAMVTELTDGSSAYLKPHLKECRSALSQLPIDNENTSRLVETVRLGLDLANKQQLETADFVRDSLWVHREYVQGYFRQQVQEFDENPYYGNTPPDAKT